jgi:hypothetical protein
MEAMSSEVEDAVAILGGRFYDLDQFIRMMHAGVSANDAVHKIISKAEVYLRNALFRSSQINGRVWRPDQLWTIMQAIAKSPSRDIEYDTTLLTVFKGDETGLSQLVLLDILSIVYLDGVPSKLRAGAMPDLQSSPLSSTRGAQADCVPCPAPCCLHRLECVLRGLQAPCAVRGCIPWHGNPRYDISVAGMGHAVT